MTNKEVDIRPKIGKYGSPESENGAVELCKLFQSGTLRQKKRDDGHFPETSESLGGYQRLRSLEEYRRDIGDMEKI